ncbi:unnamed protein product [Leptidea sinapis]|uniref:Helicase C-terminal domain-containing protein n=1 Tax=Leptidea sinapis TaxID=189913 RepID=A0A5E4QT11_9NEOP|nr:unnamed protein product [Leptidea sinapis]
MFCVAWCNKDQFMMPRPPPIFDDLNEAVKEYLLKPERLSIHQWERSQNHWHRIPDIDSLFQINEDGLSLDTTLDVVRDPVTGQIVGIEEIAISVEDDEDSLSMSRAPLPPSLATRGTITQNPFLPAGHAGDIEEESSKDNEKKVDNQELVDINLEEVIDTNAHLVGLWQDDDEEPKEKAPQPTQAKQLDEEEDENFLESTIIKPPVELPEIPVLNITSSTVRMGVTSTEWAETIDVSQPVPEAIYTSPIKALSNQKYNDFNKMFGEVGLLTGDLVINATASCLVMTTEILRSMLYCGSDVTRDLEFVIFDERGYVWEEVLILLPAHVTIVMLSATVPNTLQFADWVGRTKRRKVYVVSTAKRPVPLCHYLYTGSGGKSKHERFLVVDQEGNFQLRGYNEAVAAKKARENDYKKNFGPKGGKQFANPKAEQTMCDHNAENLMSVDLTTAKEKGHIRSFFTRCLQRLKEPDRRLPQVKILFATETFAMGVNMPARTVIFDDISKFDGLQSRSLMPAEYIQMAGRAGRRGLDDTGTVIILCKEGVPDQVTLKGMMLGIPQKLSSQFRLTYAMILSLLRVATVSVEGMMQRSFREVYQICQADNYKKQLQIAEKEFSEKCGEPLATHLTPLAKFYDTAVAYIDVLNEIMPFLLGQSKVAKEMTLINIISILMKFGTEESTMEHTILCIAPKNITAVTKTQLKLDIGLIISDWDRRQIPRFKDARPGSSCASAVQELARLSHAARTAAARLETVNLTQALNITSGELLQLLDRMNRLRAEIESQKKSTDIANFKSQFAIVYERKQAEHKRDKYKRLLSFESLALYPDYQRRLMVLRELNYIDEHDNVILKGRVACCMGTNELIISELVFRNVFTDKNPAEIAALLSCFVFQAKTYVEQVLTDKLAEGVKTIAVIEDELSKIEGKYGVSQLEGQHEGLNFGLVRVVYEWALEKPFAEIMDLTDVQEGIIVRCIQQLHELLVDVKDAAVAIGDPQLQAKMMEASTAIKRDIVFAASLYTTQKDITVS